MLFRVSLSAALTKDWSTVTRETVDGCPKTTRATGRRIINVRSSRLTTVVVALTGSRVSYTPAVVRYLAGSVSQSGTVTTDRAEPPACDRHEVRRSRCPRARRSFSGETARFFRSRRDEISFRRSSDLTRVIGGCLGESVDVREIRPSLRDAQGGISEAQFGNRRVSALYASGASEQTSDLSGDETGRVIERINWTLTFTRVRDSS